MTDPLLEHANRQLLLRIHRIVIDYYENRRMANGRLRRPTIGDKIERDLALHNVYEQVRRLNDGREYEPPPHEEQLPLFDEDR